MNPSAISSIAVREPKRNLFETRKPRWLKSAPRRQLIDAQSAGRSKLKPSRLSSTPVIALKGVLER